MASSLTSSSFELLLASLDPEPRSASEKYEELRLKLAKAFLWRGCPDAAADTLADQTLDRVAMKMSAGESVQNVSAYALTVSRFVWLEYSRRSKEVASGDDIPDIAVRPDLTINDDPDIRLDCLRKCMAETIRTASDRALILNYYSAEGTTKNKDVRNRLASDLGISMNSLKVKAFRLRAKLESCINECVSAMLVTKSGLTDTYRREEA